MTHVVAEGFGITEFTDEALAGKAVGAQSSTTQAEYIQKKYPNADIRLYKTQDEANLDMANGRLDLHGRRLSADARLDDQERGRQVLRTGRRGRSPIPPSSAKASAWPCGRKTTSCARSSTRRLAEILADGTYKKINDKYFAINVHTMKKD